MSAQILQIRDFQNKKDLDRMQRAQALEQQALEIMSIALAESPTMLGMEPVIHIEIPYGGAGIDGMFTDTSCSEMNPER